MSMNLPLITCEFLLDENILHVEVTRMALHDICAWTGGLTAFIYILVKLFVGRFCEANFIRRVV